MPGNLQDSFLAECKTQNTAVTISLGNGSQLRGIVEGFDAFTLLLEVDGSVHLVYKHAISTITSS